MNIEDGDLKQSFDRYADGQHQHVERVEPVVPDMIRADQPVMEPIAPDWAQGVDAQFFDQRWNRELRAHRAPDGFDQVDARHGQTLSQNFNAQSTGEAAWDQGHGDGFEQVDRNAGLSERFNNRARGIERS